MRRARFLLLQNAAFIPMFREATQVAARASQLTSLEPLAPKADRHRSAVAEIFADISRDKLLAARERRSR